MILDEGEKELEIGDFVFLTVPGAGKMLCRITGFEKDCDGCTRAVMVSGHGRNERTYTATANVAPWVQKATKDEVMLYMLEQ